METDSVLLRLMAAYDKRFPDATEFSRGAVEYEYRKTLDALSEAGMTVADLGVDLGAAYAARVMEQRDLTPEDERRVARMIEVPNELAHNVAKAQGIKTRKPRKPPR